jgi:hypothetical protein
MSFLAGRVERDRTGTEAASEIRAYPPPAESGISLRAPPVLLAVGLTEDVATLCALAAAEADIGFVRVAQGIAACRAIAEIRPAVVAVAPTLWRDEKHAITEAAQKVGANVIDLPPFAPPTWGCAHGRSRGDRGDAAFGDACGYALSSH